MTIRLALNSPPKNLALAYADVTIRKPILLLLSLDERLGVVVQQTSEAIVGQMRMAWWRETIAKDAAARPQGEPLVALLADIEEEYEPASIQKALIDIVDAWDLLLAEEEWSDKILLEHARLRSEGIFGIFERIHNIDSPPETLISGQHWALHDLANISGCGVTKAIDALSRATKLTGKLRPLSLLLMAARQQNLGGGRLTGLRLSWHGLTGL